MSGGTPSSWVYFSSNAERVAARPSRFNSIIAWVGNRRNGGLCAAPLVLFRTLVGGDLLDQLDDAAPELGIADAREGAGQRQSLGRGEEIRDIRRGGFAAAVRICCARRS